VKSLGDQAVDRFADMAWLIVTQKNTGEKRH
jgi:hypothetical protein